MTFTGWETTMDYDVRGTGDWGWSATLLVSHLADPSIQLPIQFKHFQYLILIKLTNFALVKKVFKILNILCPEQSRIARGNPELTTSGFCSDQNQPLTANKVDGDKFVTSWQEKYISIGFLHISLFCKWTRPLGCFSKTLFQKKIRAIPPRTPLGSI